MTPSKHNESQGRAHGNNPIEQQRSDSNLPNNMPPLQLFPTPPQWLVQMRQSRRPLRELTPEEKHQQMERILQEALTIVNEGLQPRRGRINNLSIRPPSDPATKTQ